jgi:hypothetical protein
VLTEKKLRTVWAWDSHHAPLMRFLLLTCLRISEAQKGQIELAHIVEKNVGGIPGMRSHWEESPISRPMLDEDFVKFVDKILAKGNS